MKQHPLRATFSLFGAHQLGFGGVDRGRGPGLEDAVPGTHCTMLGLPWPTQCTLADTPGPVVARGGQRTGAEGSK